MDIKEIRKFTGLSQSQFARCYEIPVRTVQQWEQGISEPPAYVKRLIEQAVFREKAPEGESYISEFRLNNPVKWKTLEEMDFDNCERIHPLQQKKVKELVDDMSHNSDVNRIIIFGSSVTDMCHIGSDVDIYVDMSRETHPISQTHWFEYDLWSNYTVDERLRREIADKGVVVYERQNQSVR